MRVLLRKHDPAHIIENIKWVRNRKNLPQDLAAFTIAAIKNDYAQGATNNKPGKLLASEDETNQNQINQQKKQETEAKLAALPKAKLQAIKKSFATAILGGKYGTTLANSFQKNRWQTKGIKSLFRGFAGSRILEKQLSQT